MTETDQKKAEALAKYLGIDAEDVEKLDYGGCAFGADGKEYFVGDSDEAQGEAEEIIQNDIDDMGMRAFSKDFQDTIKRYYLDGEWFDDALRELCENDVEDMESESAVGYDNALIEELSTRGMLEDDDFEKDEDGDPDYEKVKDSVDIDDLKSQLVEDLIGENLRGYSDAAEWYREEFGDADFDKTIEDNSLMDDDAVIKACIDDDGVASFVATYDGDEIELEGDLYAYRTD